jgi:hypothetical protein
VAIGRSLRAAFEDREPGGGGPEVAGHADQIAGLRAVAADQRVLAVGPADDRDRDRQRRPAHEVAAGDRGAAVGGQRLGARMQRDHVGLGERVGHDDRQERLAGLGAHRREVRQRAGERAVARVRGRPARAEAEVGAVDHDVDRHGGHAAGAQHGRVVAHPAQHTRVRPAPDHALDRGDQAELFSDGDRRCARG